MDLLHHEMLKTALFSRFCIPFDLRHLPGYLIPIQVVKGNLPFLQAGHLHISDIIYISRIF